MQKRAIIVSGTPGTGKSTLAKELSHLLGYAYLDVAGLIKSEGIARKYDKKRGCAVVDERELSALLIEAIKRSKKACVIDHHMSHFLPARYVQLAVITTCSIPILKERLRKRGYNEAKVRENLDAEIFETCLTEASEQGHTIFVADTGLKNPSALAKQIQALLRRDSH